MTTDTTPNRLAGLSGSGLYSKSAEVVASDGTQSAPLPTPAPAPVVPKGRRSNAYGGKCVRCGSWVGAGEGLLGAKVDGKWTTEHIACPATDAPAPTVEPQPERDVRPAEPRTDRTVIRVGKPIIDGTYTVVFADDSYRTLKVTTQDEHADFKPGAKLVAFLSGQDNEGDFTRCGEITDRGYVNVWRKHLDNETLIEALRVLVADPKAAMQAYGLKSERCGHCNRKLTVPSSIEAGIGPDCAKKFA